VGYLDQGSAKAKIPDPIRAPLVKAAFERYASGEYSLPQLAEEMYRRGLRNRNGGAVTVNGLATILKNPFYLGLMQILKAGQTFKGVHDPLISSALFEKAQAVLAGKRVDRVANHVFTYSRIARCSSCKYSLIAERQKGHVYYRCHDRPFKTPAVCPATSIREEQLEDAVLEVLTNVMLGKGTGSSA
jgi:site-specific DNA recombinase